VASTFSVDGLLSGLKTRDIIDQLIALERRPMDLAQGQLDREQARLKAMQSVSSQVTNLQTVVAKLTQRSQINVKMATTDTPAGSPPVLTATAGPGALNGSFAVTVSRLATATRMTGNAPLGQVIDKNVALADAGFRLSPVTEKNGGPATFSINGVSIAVDSTTTLDDGTANSIIAKINAAGAGVTASLVADADGRANNRVQLVSNSGQAIQLGSLGDSSNVLRLLNLADAAPTGYTAANVTGSAVAAGALNTSITINGITTAINQADGGFTSQQNAAFIAQQLNGNGALNVRAIDNGDGTIKLEHKTLGAQQTIDVTSAGTGTGLAVGQTKNGTDRIVSMMNLGVANTGKPLADARLATPISGLDAQGNGKFSINGVEIAYSATDSLADVVNRINASTAGVTAAYDAVQDRLRISALQTGAQSISLQDVTGNLLAATGVLGATQTLGQQAQFTIEGVNGGQPLTSNSNTISDYVPGVTLTLRSVSATPVTVTVGQDSAATAGLVRSFVDTFNKTLDIISAATSTDEKAKGILAGDPGLAGVERTLRSATINQAVGSSGLFRTLADIGISTGATGSAPGSTKQLKLDEAKLNAALQSNPQAVEAVLASFTSSLGAPSGVGNATAVSGTPTGQHENGTYNLNVLNAATGEVEVRFTTTDGRVLLKKTGTLAPNTQNSTLIPGLTISTGAALTVGEDTFSLTVASKGVMVGLQDAIDGLLAKDRFFDGRKAASEAISKQLTDRIATMETRLADKEAALVKKFARLESTLAQLQAQSAALSGQIAKLAGG
jgi:flagellar hook-associated protein 2